MNCSYPTSYPASLFGILLLPPFMKPVCQLRFVFVQAFPVSIWFPDGVTISSPSCQTQLHYGTIRVLTPLPLTKGRGLPGYLA